MQEKTTNKKWIALWVGIVCICTYVVNYYLRNILSVATPELLLNGSFTEAGVGLLSSTYMIFTQAVSLLTAFWEI